MFDALIGKDHCRTSLVIGFTVLWYGAIYWQPELQERKKVSLETIKALLNRGSDIHYRLQSVENMCFFMNSKGHVGSQKKRLLLDRISTSSQNISQIMLLIFLSCTPDCVMQVFPVKFLKKVLVWCVWSQEETEQTNISVTLTLKPAGSQLPLIPVGLQPDRPDCFVISIKHVSNLLLSDWLHILALVFLRLSFSLLKEVLRSIYSVIWTLIHCPVQ